MFAAQVERIPSTPAPAAGVLHSLVSRAVTDAAVAADWFRRAQCGLRGHWMMMHFEAERLSLRCQSCGHETPGWAIQGGKIAH
jgi:hypothetical protein